MYDVSGKKVDERLYPSASFGRYFEGRNKEKLRFMVGDVVEYWGELGIVVSVPTKHYNKICDSSDDCYYVTKLKQDFDSKDRINHMHAECIKIMPPTFSISEKVQQQIERVKEWYFECLKNERENIMLLNLCAAISAYMSF